MPHTLILARHGQHVDAEHGVLDGPLSPRGHQQAQLLAHRLAGLKIDGMWHSPLQQTWDTANVLASALGVESQPSALLLPCVPSGSEPGMPKAYDPFFGSVTDEEVDAGRAQMDDAIAEFMARGRSGKVDILVTHNAVIAWFVRTVLGSDEWKWVTLNQNHCGLTVLQQKSGRPWTLVSHNDVGHLSVDLRSGLPEPYSL
jgi:probable phosphoglycerate mutase